MTPINEGPFRPIYDPPRDEESISPAVGHVKANRILKGPPDSGVGDLECEIFTETYERPSGGEMEARGTRSRFIPSEDQMKRLQNGAHICLEVMAHPTPPVWVGVEAPTCDDCGEAMSWDAKQEIFYCVHPADYEEPGEEMGCAVPDPTQAVLVGPTGSSGEDTTTEDE